MPDIGATCSRRSADQVDRLFAEARPLLGGLDALIRQRRIAGPTLPAMTRPKDWQRTLYST